MAPASIVLALSLFGPPTIPDIPGKMIVTLMAMHVVAAVVGIGTLTRFVQR